MTTKKAQRIKTAVAKNTIYIREALGISRQELAKKVGVDIVYIKILEEGRLDITLYVAINLAAALDVNMMVLAGERPMPRWVDLARKTGDKNGTKKKAKT